LLVERASLARRASRRKPDVFNVALGRCFEQETTKATEWSNSASGKNVAPKFDFNKSKPPSA
jgi:hypothetical protein